MADSNDGEWVATPVGADEIVISLKVGENVELSDEAREAIEELIGSLEDAEVTGHAVGRFINICPLDTSECGKYSCELGKCLPESRNPCAADWKCKIASFI